MSGTTLSDPEPNRSKRSAAMPFASRPSGLLLLEGPPRHLTPLGEPPHYEGGPPERPYQAPQKRHADLRPQVHCVGQATQAAQGDDAEEEHDGRGLPELGIGRADGPPKPASDPVPAGQVLPHHLAGLAPVAREQLFGNAVGRCVGSGVVRLHRASCPSPPTCLGGTQTFSSPTLSPPRPAKGVTVASASRLFRHEAYALERTGTNVKVPRTPSRGEGSYILALFSGST